MQILGESSTQTLQQQWAACWPEALACWSRFTQLQEPRWCLSAQDEKRESLTGSFAMIRLTDHAVVIGLSQVEQYQLQPFAIEILAHEIGHHIFCPGNLGDHARCLARMRRSLPTREQLAPMIANLYTDLLINDRLKRGSNLRMDEVYRVLESRPDSDTSKLWTLYLRIYEILWNLPKGDLARSDWDATLEADAVLGARVIRSYAKDWLRGAGRFAALCLPYVMDDEENKSSEKIWLDATKVGQGNEIPDGLSEMDEDEISGAIHPAFDEELSGVKNSDSPQEYEGEKRGTGSDSGNREKNFRDPAEYAEILRAAGVELSDHEIAIRYYRERALPHLIRFPSRPLPQSTEPLPEGTENWEPGDRLEDLDWMETCINSPVIVPGWTTRQRIYGDSPGQAEQREIDDLYIGIDCSGSMPNPQVYLSYPVLAGTIMALSALRAGARVMTVLSGDPGPMISTGDFLRDEHKVLEVLTGYLGTGYAFGVHHMAQTFEAREENARRAHIVLVTDADLFHMMDEGDKKQTNWERTRALLPKAASGTCALNIEESYYAERVQRLRGDGWKVHSVRDWTEIVAFARAWSKENYEKI